jgi:hypothetical protein
MAMTLTRQSSFWNIDPSLEGSPAPSLPRSQKRQHQSTEIHDDMEPKARRTRLGESYTSMEKVADAMKELARARRSDLAIAVELLEDKYTGRLANEHMDMALALLENATKAAIFGRMRNEESRDRWRERNAGVEIISSWDIDT